MSERADKAAGALKDGGQWAKTAATKLYVLAQDPEVQAKAAKLLENGKKVYRAAISPEAKDAYRKAAELLKKARKK